ncbi:MAG: hypothetical protein ACK4TA_22445 [Saprospiraceae bacterium]
MKIYLFLLIYLVANQLNGQDFRIGDSTNMILLNSNFRIQVPTPNVTGEHNMKKRLDLDRDGIDDLLFEVKNYRDYNYGQGFMYSSVFLLNPQVRVGVVNSYRTSVLPLEKGDIPLNNPNLSWDSKDFGVFGLLFEYFTFGGGAGGSGHWNGGYQSNDSTLHYLAFRLEKPEGFKYG